MLSEKDKKELIEAVSGLSAEDAARPPSRLAEESPEAAQYRSDIQRLAGLLEAPADGEFACWDEARVEQAARAIQARRRWRRMRRWLPVAGTAAAVLLLAFGLKFFNDSRPRGLGRPGWESVTVAKYGAFASAGSGGRDSDPVSGPLLTSTDEVAIVRSRNGTRLICAPVTRIRIETDGSIMLIEGQVMVRATVPLVLKTAKEQIRIEDGEMHLVGLDRGMWCIVFRGQANVAVAGQEHLVRAGHMFEADPLRLVPTTRQPPDFANFAADFDEFRSAR